MDLFTIHVSRWRLARNRDIAFMDTTVKSGNTIFSPDWTMVLGHKSNTLSDEEYTKLYYERMNRSWKEHRKEWLTVIESSEPLAIACYCKSDTYNGCFCHRYLLKDIFEKLCASRNIPFYYYGELTPNSL